MSSSEEDYMSDSFLVGCVKEDIRPGLIHTHSDRRNLSILKKKQDKDEINKKKNPSSKLMESENRETALNQPITVDNKGFAMLQKLGFKPGSGLGKSNAGRIEPVPIELKSGRQGLGHAQALKDSIAMKAAARKEILSKLTNVNDYRSHLAEKTAERRTLIDLKKSQRICKRLDTDLGVIEPNELWYWPDTDREEPCNNYDDNEDIDQGVGPPEAEQPSEDDENGAEEEKDDRIKSDGQINYEDCYTVKDKLEILTHYLRTTHYYCIWCAVQYDDEHDLKQECPGPTHSEH